MHEKCFKIDFFFAIFWKLQKKLPSCKKKYAKILNVARAVVTRVEKNEKRNGRIFFGSHLEEQSVRHPPTVQRKLLNHFSSKKSLRGEQLFPPQRRNSLRFWVLSRAVKINFVIITQSPENFVLILFNRKAEFVLRWPKCCRFCRIGTGGRSLISRGTSTDTAKG